MYVHTLRSPDIILIISTRMSLPARPRPPGAAATPTSCLLLQFIQSGIHYNIVTHIQTYTHTYEKYMIQISEIFGLVNQLF